MPGGGASKYLKRWRTRHCLSASITHVNPHISRKDRPLCSTLCLYYHLPLVQGIQYIVSVESLTSSAPGGQRGCRLNHVSDAEAIVGNELLEQSDDIC